MTIHSGVVEEVSGIEEKIQSAVHAFCHTVLLPASHQMLYYNKPVVSEKLGEFPYQVDTILKFSQDIRDKVTVFGVANVKEAINFCLVPEAKNGTVWYFIFPRLLNAMVRKLQQQH